MGNAVFPTLPGLKINVKKTPVWRTKIQTSANGRELRGAYFSYPQWRFSLSFEVLRSRSGLNELARLAGFFNARRGSFESFLYDDPDDNTAENQVFGRIAAGQPRYQLVRSLDHFTEPVWAVKGSPVIRAGGRVLQFGRDYQIDERGGVLIQAALPVATVLDWSGGFYFRVRFLQDTADFEKVLQHLWTAKKIEFQSIKP